MWRHVLERMRMSSVAGRLRAIVERDLKGEAAELLAYRKANGEGPVLCLPFYLFAYWPDHNSCSSLSYSYTTLYATRQVMDQKTDNIASCAGDHPIKNPAD